jgi:hypothetical protein
MVQGWYYFRFLQDWYKAHICLSSYQTTRVLATSVHNLIPDKGLHTRPTCPNQCWAVLECWLGSQLGSQNENQLTLLHVRTKIKTKFRFSYNWEPVVRTDSNLYIYIYLHFLENRTSSLIELISNSQSSLYHLLVPLVLVLTWGLLLFSNYYFSHIVLLFLCDEVIKLLII